MFLTLVLGALFPSDAQADPAKLVTVSLLELEVRAPAPLSSAHFKVRQVGLWVINCFAFSS